MDFKQKLLIVILLFATQISFIRSNEEKEELETDDSYKKNAKIGRKFYLCFCVFVCLFIYLFVCLFTCLFAFVFVHIFVCLFVVCMFVLLVSLFVCIFVCSCLFVYVLCLLVFLLT